MKYNKIQIEIKIKIKSKSKSKNRGENYLMTSSLCVSSVSPDRSWWKRCDGCIKVREYKKVTKMLSEGRRTDKEDKRNRRREKEKRKEGGRGEGEGEYQ